MPITLCCVQTSQSSTESVTKMGFEGFISSKWAGLVRHKRSKSLPDSRVPEEDKLDLSTEAATPHNLVTDMRHLNGCGDGKKKQSSHADIQNSLREEIVQLEKKLQEQVYVRCALETTLSCGALSHDITNETIIPKPAIELLKEIAVLELEVGRLEKYLLSLYRKAFDQRISSLSPSKKDEEFESPLATPSRRCLDFSRSDMTTVREKFAPEAETRIMTGSSEEANSPSEEKLIDSVAQHSHSSLSRHSALVNRTSLPAHASVKAVLRACQSQPSSMIEVRIYTPNAVFQELEAAKEDYIRATLGVGKDHKVLLPKLVESYAKDSGLCPAGIMEMMQHILPDSQSKSIKEHDQTDKSHKNIEWVSHNFSFRYLILKDMGK
ncbi:UNVERIFIED_CONTAM: hypothetical protein Slati_0038200 [Sesamum latifolium]|uniref:Ternary complex factor MIP1 leucine-zipper domain-containing protein n=1 Tax=Sesamum latifolium TaxID=2727402 RepID=A0AAW2Y760_9LAMI